MDCHKKQVQHCHETSNYVSLDDRRGVPIRCTYKKSVNRFELLQLQTIFRKKTCMWLCNEIKAVAMVRSSGKSNKNPNQNNQQSNWHTLRFVYKIFNKLRLITFYSHPLFLDEIIRSSPFPLNLFHKSIARHFWSLIFIWLRELFPKEATNLVQFNLLNVNYRVNVNSIRTEWLSQCDIVSGSAPWHEW